MPEPSWPDIEDSFYEEEIEYLVDAGREYARLHPNRARFLNLSDPRARDPHVERLIESFAFLAARIRRKIVDDFPELTSSLLEFVCPQFLRPIPPIAMLQFMPVRGTLLQRRVVPRGSTVDSRSVTSGGVSCRFQTAYPVDVYPFRVHEAGWITGDDGERRLRLRFKLDPQVDPRHIDISRLRIYLAGEPRVAYGIYRFLCCEVSSVCLRFDRERARVIGPECIRPVGFSEGEELLSYSRHSFPGYRLLSEYFAFPDKFRFVEFTDLGTVDLDKGNRYFDLEVEFQSRPPEHFHLAAEDFRLYVTPIVNLFQRDGEPIRVTNRKTSYPVIADFSHRSAYEVISVDSVYSSSSGTDETTLIPSFYSFDHESAADGVHYHLTQHLGPAGSWDTKLALVSGERGALPPKATLSLLLTCTNGRLCDEIAAEDVCMTSDKRLEFVRFKSITHPTAPIYPGRRGDSERRFISHLALNHLALSEVSNLRGLLELYDAGDSPGNRRRIDGVKAVRSDPDIRLIAGVPVRGTRLTLDLEEAHFEESGDLLMFAQVLRKFFSLYAPVNSFIELTVRRMPSEEVLSWPPVRGTQSLI